MRERCGPAQAARPPRPDRLLRQLHGRARLGEQQLIEGARRSDLEELTDWTLWSDKSLVF